MLFRNNSREPKFIYRLTDVEAVAKIRKLPRAHQGIIARVIWWDWFGSRITKDRTDKFDKWLTGVAPLTEPPVERLVKSLVKCGYPEYLAIRRLKPKYKKLTLAERKAKLEQLNEI
jgi:hypothetical protein